MPDPYQTLGLSPHADKTQAEAAFRRLLMEAHPDRHVGADSRALAEAERRTRELTDAIAAVRKGWRPATGPSGEGRSPHVHRPRQHRPSGPSPWERTFGFSTTDGTDWFGNPTAREEQVAAVSCPWCGEPFWHVYDFEQHLLCQHDAGSRIRAASRRRTGSRFANWLRFLPMPSLSLLLVLLAWWYGVVVLLPTSIERVGIWVGVLGFLYLRWLIFHLQRR